MHKRTAHRWRLTITMLAGTFFAFGTFWLVQLQNDNLDVDPDAFKNEPDYIVEKFSVVRMTPQGQPRYVVSGAKLTHRPLNDVSDVVSPVVQSIAPGHPPTTITAQSGRIRHTENQVDLLGKVDINRPPSPDTEAMRLKTEALTIFPDEDRMASSLPVHMTLGSATITGTGMQANNATRRVKIASDGQIVYPPKASR